MREVREVRGGGVGGMEEGRGTIAAALRREGGGTKSPPPTFLKISKKNLRNFKLILI